MKIIGHVDKEGYVVEIGKYEMAAITGVEERYGDLLRQKVGASVEVSKAWNQLAPIIRSACELRTRAQTIRGLADVLDGTAALVDRATELTPPVLDPSAGGAVMP